MSQIDYYVHKSLREQLTFDVVRGTFDCLIEPSIRDRKCGPKREISPWLFVPYIVCQIRY